MENLFFVYVIDDTPATLLKKRKKIESSPTAILTEFIGKAFL